MRKYIIGGIVGFTLAFSLSAHAEEAAALIGRTVQGAFPVKLNGQTLPNQAIVVDGTSYLPVRAIGEALGYNIMFDPDMGITLERRTGPEAQATSPAAPVITETGTSPEAGYKKLTKAVFTLTIGDTVKTLKKSGAFDYIDVDGNQYLSIISLSNIYTVSWSDPLFSISLNNRLVASVTSGAAYAEGTNAFSYDGTTFVNLSALGLHAAIDGDTLVIGEE
ncbi:hypothetical protein ACFFK0_26970 [Paenibacillus chartarius]|uniref:Copper amine oxidase-like N-terminal domain-containing protein n=1 Tax=Paenibacillus chartarius TaxID=747481 RepID=A0ABV6DTT4_9BACL